MLAHLGLRDGVSSIKLRHLMGQGMEFPTQKTGKGAASQSQSEFET